MIFRAQSTNSTDNPQSSLTSSFTSTDSAIGECCETNRNSHHHYRHHKHSNSMQREQQHIYGQFYFSDQIEYDSPTIRIKGYNSINEKTPLVSSLDATNNKSTSQHCNYNQCSQQLDLVNHDRTGSVQLDLGLPIKNSTCLAGNVGQLDFSNGKNLNQQQLEHDENWVSSNWILLPMLPLTLSMKVLTPFKFKTTCWTIWTFLVSIVLIGGLTYVSVWMVHLFGQTVGIPETIAGMTILSWGTGIPELIASIVLIKKTAQADMAICNTIGSNVIDISFCLSLPW